MVFTVDRGTGLKDAFRPWARIGDGAEASDLGEPVGHPVMWDDIRLLNLRERFKECWDAMSVVYAAGGQLLLLKMIFPRFKICSEKSCLEGVYIRRVWKQDMATPTIKYESTSMTVMVNVECKRRHDLGLARHVDVSFVQRIKADRECPIWWVAFQNEKLQHNRLHSFPNIGNVVELYKKN